MASSLPDATKQRFAGGDANLKFNIVQKVHKTIQLYEICISYYSYSE